ncbi:Maf-like protein [Mycobacterium sp. Y57]|uniref:Maf family protein n=1 Tax=Mycolicibacterium xanthum TaxID=2796469 RepID=UPI001C862B44|nr:nucleoside triphosphate pyrophosphatase [Mycolicibacterium xanthum]MBX7435253.1 Maf-like protein [Mycolicibacterium xanthum]
MTRFVLGSASTGRLRVLRQAGIEPLVIVSDIDEDAVVASLQADTAPEAVVAELAHTKAAAVAAQLPDDVATDCVVLGCDSMLYRDGALCGKPGSAEAARRQWLSLVGSTGYLLTGHVLLRITEGVTTHTDSETASTTVHFGTPTETELSAYIETGEPAHVAGAFTLDGLGGWFIDRIEGDPSNVIGLSLPLARRMLSGVGVSVTDLWKQ